MYPLYPILIIYKEEIVSNHETQNVLETGKEDLTCYMTVFYQLL